MISKEKANLIYDILVTTGGAHEGMRDSFVFHHCDAIIMCEEWRFQGKLSSGGKYRSKTNTVDCYPEDETPARLQLIDEINEKLSKINL